MSSDLTASCAGAQRMMYRSCFVGIFLLSGDDDKVCCQLKKCVSCNFSDLNVVDAVCLLFSDFVGSTVDVGTVCCDVVKVEAAEVWQQSTEYVAQIDELTQKLSEASSLIAELRQQQVVTS